MHCRYFHQANSTNVLISVHYSILGLTIRQCKVAGTTAVQAIYSSLSICPVRVLWPPLPLAKVCISVCISATVVAATTITSSSVSLLLSSPSSLLSFCFIFKRSVSWGLFAHLAYSGHYCKIKMVSKVQ